MIVVDTNVLIYRFVASSYSGAAETLARLDPEWHCPALWRSEFSNFLAGEIRRKRLTLIAALEIFSRAERRVHSPYSHDAAAVLGLVSLSHCTAYDLEFVALARQLRVPLVTMDRQILTTFPGIARPLVQA